MKEIQKVLVVNCGSSSLKFQLFDMKGEKMLCKGLVERIGIDGSRLVYTKTGCEKVIREIEMKNHVEAIQQVMAVLTDAEIGVIKSLKELDAIGHRVVHGGDKFSAPAKITAAAKKLIQKCVPLAPLHNPANLQGIEACEKAAKGVPNVGVFDTAFHQTMPGCAYQYALPRDVARKYGLRKYGFHGTSHKFITQAAAAWLKKPLKKVNLVTCHLGNGSSIAAVKGGECLDTTMGLTPLDGLVMGTRSGTVDPGVLFFLGKQGYTLEQLDKMLNKESGFQGLTGAFGGDTRDVVAKSAKGEIDAVEALEAFGHRAALFVGGYNTLIGGADAIVMAGGIGENAADLREQIIKRLGALGVKLDKKANKSICGGKSGVITTKDSKIPVVVIPTNEELMIARETVQVLSK
ncbi:MAG: acetate kinase [Kiritimatiellae bacterium]|nr:acetate kinase [Kiritimatiellia bacterium]